MQVIIKSEAWNSTKLVSAGFVLPISSAASSDNVFVILKHFSRMMLETDREVRGGVVHNDVFPMGHSEWIGSLSRDKLGKFVVSDTGLAKVYHCGAVSSLDKVHLGEKGKSGTQAVPGGVNRVGGIEVSEARDFNQHVWKNVSLWLLEAAVDRASFALRVSLPINSDNPEICNKILDVWGTSKNHVDRLGGG